MKKFLKTFSLIFVCILLIGCGSDSSEIKEKTYTSNGLSITMKEGLLEKTNENFEVYFETSDMIFMGNKETFEELSIINLDANSTLDEYLDLIISVNGESSGKLKDGDLNYFTYEREVNGNKFFYVGSVYKANDAFWLCNFACAYSDKDTYEDLFIKWAKTVSFE